jgi:hypothetical protein
MNPLATRGKMDWFPSTRRPWAIHEIASPRCNLFNNTAAAMRSSLGFKAQTRQTCRPWFEAETTKPTWSRIAAMPSPRCRRVSRSFSINRSPSACAPALTWSTRRLDFDQHSLHQHPRTYTCLSMFTSTRHPRAILRSLVPWSKPSRPPFTVPSPSCTNSSLDLLHYRRPSHTNTCASLEAKRHAHTHSSLG